MKTCKHSFIPRIVTIACAELHPSATCAGTLAELTPRPPVSILFDDVRSQPDAVTFKTMLPIGQKQNRGMLFVGCDIKSFFFLRQYRMKGNILPCTNPQAYSNYWIPSHSHTWSHQWVVLSWSCRRRDCPGGYTKAACMGQMCDTAGHKQKLYLQLKTYTHFNHWVRDRLSFMDIQHLEWHRKYEIKREMRRKISQE